MLGDGGDFRVDGFDGRARRGHSSDGARVAFQSAVDESIYLALDVASGLGVRECLVSSCLLKAVGVRDFTEASSSGCVSEQTENRVHDAVRVVLCQTGLYGCQKLLVRMLCQSC